MIIEDQGARGHRNSLLLLSTSITSAVYIVFNAGRAASTVKSVKVSFSEADFNHESK